MPKTKLPDHITKLLSSMNPEDIKLGLELSKAFVSRSQFYSLRHKYFSMVWDKIYKDRSEEYALIEKTFSSQTKKIYQQLRPLEAQRSNARQESSNKADQREESTRKAFYDTKYTASDLNIKNEQENNSSNKEADL